MKLMAHYPSLSPSPRNSPDLGAAFGQYLPLVPLKQLQCISHLTQLSHSHNSLLPELPFPTGVQASNANQQCKPELLHQQHIHLGHTSSGLRSKELPAKPLATQKGVNMFCCWKSRDIKSQLFFKRKIKREGRQHYRYTCIPYIFASYIIYYLYGTTSEKLQPRYHLSWGRMLPSIHTHTYLSLWSTFTK